MEEVHKSCKICGSQDLEAWNVDEDLSRCRRCDFVFASRVYTPEDLRATYHEMYSETGGYRSKLEAFERLRAGSRVRLGWNKRVVLRGLRSSATGRVLELGAGVGVAARHFRERGAEYVGIELDETVAHKAAAAGFPIFAGDIRTAHTIAPAGKFDAVVAFEVLEHVQDIGECLRQLHGLLRPGGLLGFSVPNRRICENVKPPRLNQTGPPVHLNFWTRESLERTLALFGFKLVMLRERPFPIRSGNHWADARRYARALVGRHHGQTLAGVARATGPGPDRSPAADSRSH